VLIAVLLGAGIYLSVLRLPHVHDLWTAGYGRVLLVKLGLVSVALAWGGLHKLVALPAVERGEGRILTRLPKSLLGESAVGRAVPRRARRRSSPFGGSSTSWAASTRSPAG